MTKKSSFKAAVRTAVSAGFITLGISAQAATVVVTPADVGTAPAANQWYLTNYRDTTTGAYTSTTVAAVTNANPRDGNGSVQMSSTDGSGKADYAYSWGFDSSRTLGSLSTLGYDWYRSSASTNPAVQQPAFRLFFDADGNASTTNDRGYLVWEQVYNGTGTVPVDQWVSSNILGGDFWMRTLTPGFTVEAFDTSLLEWANGDQPAAGAIKLSGNTAILGIEFGIGSGWNGAFSGNVDNVRFAFGDEAVSSFNFETAAVSDVPEPTTLALFGLALLGLVGTRRRR